MAIQQLNPYLSFDGTAREVIAFYTAVLGAKVELVMTFADAPGDPPPPELKDRVMHAALAVAGNTLMVSDAMPGMTVAKESNITLSLSFATVPEMEACFAALAEGGNVTLAPHDAFWGSRFALLSDRFGVKWMFSCEQQR